MVHASLGQPSALVPPCPVQWSVVASEEQGWHDPALVPPQPLRCFPLAQSCAHAVCVQVSLVPAPLEK